MISCRALGLACCASSLLALSTLVHTGGPARAQEPVKGGEITYVYPSGPSSLDPHNAGQAVEVEVIFHLFETLVTLGENYEAVPALASSIDVSDDARTYTFHLRKGVKFHNGKIMSSADVLASYERYREFGGSPSILADVERFDTPDPDTFVVHLKNPNTVFLDTLKTARHAIGILPAEERNKPARESAPIGTGPFKVGEWVRDSHLVIERFDDYVQNGDAAGPDGYGGRKTVHLDSVRYRFVPEINSRVAALQAGDADVASEIPPDLAAQVKGNSQLTIREQFPFASAVFILNTKNAPTSNLLVRKAIQALVNVDDVMAVTGLPHRRNPSMLYETSEYHPGNALDGYYSINDVERAKQLLAESGYAGEPILMQTTATFPQYRDAILVLSEMMKSIGMNVTVDLVDWTTNINNLNTGAGGWNVSAVQSMSHPLIGPTAYRPTIYTMPQIDSDEILDEAFARFFTGKQLEERKAAWADIEKQINEQVYFIKIGDYGSSLIHNFRVNDIRPWYTIRYWDVWVDDAGKAE